MSAGLSEFVICGALDNAVDGLVTGWIRFCSGDSDDDMRWSPKARVIFFKLEGNFTGHNKGKHVYFRGPSQQTKKLLGGETKPASHYIPELDEKQIGRLVEMHFDEEGKNLLYFQWEGPNDDLWLKLENKDCVTRVSVPDFVTDEQKEAGVLACPRCNRVVCVTASMTFTCMPFLRQDAFDTNDCQTCDCENFTVEDCDCGAAFDHDQDGEGNYSVTIVEGS